MLAIERRNAILEKLQEEKRVVVSELSQMFEVSEETIRRDLEKFEQEGLATKSYGGAVINENINMDLPFNVRKNHNVVGKQKIAAIVADMIGDGARIMLDASSTAVAIAKAIKDRKNITLITNSVEIIVELFDVPGWTILSTGGIAKPGSFALVGQLTDRMIAEYHVDLSVISCKGLDMQSGFMDSDAQHAANKNTMLHAADKRILAVDKSKFSTVAFAKIGGLKDVDIVVTDVQPEDAWLQLFEANRVECRYPK
ncbi:MAG: DeoR/GlpR family DNA-binding transcription regulator [Lachnospiraceae bacterium]